MCVRIRYVLQEFMCKNWTNGGMVMGNTYLPQHTQCVQVRHAFLYRAPPPPSPRQILRLMILARIGGANMRQSLTSIGALEATQAIYKLLQGGAQYGDVMQPAEACRQQRQCRRIVCVQEKKILTTDTLFIPSSDMFAKSLGTCNSIP